MVLLIIGGIGLAVLLVSLVAGDLLGLDGALDSDVFSVASLAGFCGALGFAGAAVQATTGSLPAALVVGSVAGLAVAWFAWWLTRTLRASRTDATVGARDLVGRSGTVLTPIPAEGHGEVVLRIGGQPVKYAARAHEPLSEGTRVWVSDVLSSTAVEVRPADALTP